MSASRSNSEKMHKLTTAITEALASHRLAEALRTLGDMANELRAPFAITSRIAALTENHAMLARFLIDGVDDPHRDEIASDIAAEASSILRSLTRRRLCDDNSPSLYFSTMRFEATRPDDTIPSLIDSYVRALADKPAADTEAMATRLFNRLWVTFPLTRADSEALHAALAADISRLPGHTRILLIGALLLGGLQYFDDRRAVLLADIYRCGPRDKVGIVALTALILLLAATPRHATGSRRLRNALRALADSPHLADDTTSAFMQLIHSRDTERITRKINDEIMPDLMRMARDNKDLLDDDSPQSIIDDDGGLNPDWEERLDSSGLSERLRELSELQDEGADTTMASMANLKDFPFFNEPANWFLPFYPAHSAAASTDVGFLARSIADNPRMCSSDKYSLLLMASRFSSRIPDGIRHSLEEMNLRMKEETASLAPQSSSTLNSQAANSFVRDIYRFFRLFRRRDEFTDPFLHPLNPLTTPLLDTTVATDTDALSLAAEFYFSRGYYPEALTIFAHLQNLAPPTPELYQKQGYALERTGSPEEALAMYDTADLLDSTSVWTLRRMGHLLTASGRHREALAIYDRIQALRPDRYPDLTARARLLSLMNRHTDALALWYKADYLRPDRPDTLRAIIRCQLITGQYGKALHTARRLESLREVELAPQDHILIGHAHIASAHNPQSSPLNSQTSTPGFHAAVEAYARALVALQSDSRQFRLLIEADTPLLHRTGISPLTLAIVTEAAETRASSIASPL